MITAEDYFGRVSHIEAPDETVKANADTLLKRVNALLVACGFKTGVASGWRPPAYNAELRRKFIAGEPGGANTAVRSRHMTGEAIDLTDTAEQQIALHLFTHQDLLVLHGLYMEHPIATKGKNTNWCHLQSQPPGSGNRVFIP